MGINWPPWLNFSSLTCLTNDYHISVNSFRGNCSFLRLKLLLSSNYCRNNLMAETIQGQKLLAEIRYVPKYGSKDLSCRPLSATLSGHMLPVVASPNFYLALTFQVCNGIKRLREYIKCSDRAANNEVPTKFHKCVSVITLSPSAVGTAWNSQRNSRVVTQLCLKVMVLIESIFLRQILYEKYVHTRVTLVHTDTVKLGDT